MINEDIFSEKVDQVNAVFENVMNSNFSNFYKDKYEDLDYEDLNISSYNQFKKIPLLTKNEILSAPLNQRTFIKKNEIRRYNLTSGTTKNNKILAIPLGQNEKPGSKPYSANSIDVKNKKCLVLFPPMAAAFTAYMIGAAGREGIIIPGDVNNLKRTAMVVKELVPEVIFTTPTILEFLLKDLNKINFDTGLIQHISLGGENTSKLKLDYLKTKFTKANIVFRYGASETGGLRGYRCQYLASRSPDIYHPGDVLVEVVDDLGEVVPDGEVGEILHTDLIFPKGFPFIRYKTGDIGSTYYAECPCGNNRIIKLGGRANYDILKFSGVTLYSEQIEKSISDFSELIMPTFEMHVYEEVRADKIMPKLLLKVAPKNDQNLITAKLIEAKVTEKLFLSANKNLKYFVENGIFLPLEVEFVEKDQLSSTKRTGIISHL